MRVYMSIFCLKIVRAKALNNLQKNSTLKFNYTSSTYRSINYIASFAAIEFEAKIAKI